LADKAAGNIEFQRQGMTPHGYDARRNLFPAGKNISEDGEYVSRGAPEIAA
jgi:hypothetical protein